MNLFTLTRGFVVHSLNMAMNCLPQPAAIQSNKQFKNKYKGKRIFILGSGPSIKTQDLRPLQNEFVMTQNHFHAHNDIEIIKPDFHVVVPKYQPPQYDSDWIEWFNSMNERLPNNCQFFFGLNTKKFVEKTNLFENRRFYVLPGLKPLFMQKARYDITKRIMTIPTVITQCISIALYMGFSEIYLVGFDLNQICMLGEQQQVRFYNNSPITRNEAEQKIVSEMRADASMWFAFWLIWKQLILLEKAAKKLDIKITNLSGGILDVFERKNYAETLAKLKIIDLPSL